MAHKSKSSCSIKVCFFTINRSHGLIFFMYIAHAFMYIAIWNSCGIILHQDLLYLRQVLLRGWKGPLGGCGCVFMGGSMCWEGLRTSFVSFSLSSDVQSALEEHPFSSEACQLWGQVNKPILPHYPPTSYPRHTRPPAPTSLCLCICVLTVGKIITLLKQVLKASCSTPFPASGLGWRWSRQGGSEKVLASLPLDMRTVCLGTSQSLALTLSSRPPGVKHNGLRATRSVRHWDTLNLPGLSTSRLHDWENLCLPESFAPGYRMNPSLSSY